MTAPAAAVVTVDSSSYGLFVDLRVTPLIGGTIGPVAATGGVAAPAYSTQNQVASVAASIGLGTTGGIFDLVTFSSGINTGILTSTATSAFPVTPTGDASATVNDLGFTLQSQLLALPPIVLLSIGSSEVVSTSSVEGFGAPSATGFTSLANLTLTGTALGGLTIGAGAFANPAANTVLLDLLGLRIVLNEQITSGNSIGSAGIMTNAIHVSFNNFLLGTNLLNGDLIIGHSEAEIAGLVAPGVPEPAVWLQMIAGFGAVGLLARRRQRRVAA